ncbi:MAG: Plug domain-containing protein [Alphaproteobacteria bacterium]|nr:Plug domain-containing protein [Alphaproteobacteria bacterium]
MALTLRMSILTSVGALALDAAWLNAANAQGADEIIVQARKRAESLQNIPVAASVLGQDDIIELGGIIDPDQIAENLTGIQANSGVTGAPGDNQEFFIRGAGSGRVQQTDPATIQLRNGANIAGGNFGRVGSPIDFFDLEQVEVYRGAQGSLYGRSAA